MRTSPAWRRRAEISALALAFVGTVIVGRVFSARAASASQSHRLSADSLPTLAYEMGVRPLVILVGRETIVRIGERAGHRVYSVFDRSGAPLATRLSRADLARQFPNLRLEEMRDVTTGFVPDSSILADTPDPVPTH